MTHFRRMIAIVRPKAVSKQPRRVHKLLFSLQINSISPSALCITFKAYWHLISPYGATSTPKAECPCAKATFWNRNHAAFPIFAHDFCHRNFPALNSCAIKTKESYLRTRRRVGWWPPCWGRSPRGPRAWRPRWCPRPAPSCRREGTTGRRRSSWPPRKRKRGRVRFHILIGDFHFRLIELSSATNCALRNCLPSGQEMT